MSSGSSTKAVEAEGALPVPEDFPVVWEEPADAQRTWRLDRLHHPDPIAPIDFWFFREIVCQGIISAAPVYDRPMEFVPRRINAYMYVSAVPQPVPDGSDGTSKLTAAALRVRELWEDELLPEVEEHLRWWSSCDLASLSLDELLSHLDETIERAKRVWHLHFVVTSPAFTPVVELADLYGEVCDASDLDAFRLVQGFGNKTVETGRELWKLSRAAVASPDVARALDQGSPAAVAEALEATDAGRAWLSDLRAFLDTFGQRSDTFGIAGPSWIEDPSTPLDTIRRFASRSEDPYAHLERLAAEREAAVAVARGRFADAPAEARERFERLLPAAQAGNIITEDHGFYIDFASTYQVRRVFVEIGRRLTDEGVLEDPNDVAMLELDEIIETADGLPKLDRRELVRARRQEMRRFERIHPPEFLGARPAGSPPDDPRSRFARRFYGPPVTGVIDGALRGAPGAPGRVRGVARLVLDLGSASKLGPGEVLVTRTTTPAWTPLFAVAAAVVTDGGGSLSHCAIVAREYEIPAVVGTMHGTVTIRDGATIEVDGDEGFVRILG